MPWYCPLVVERMRAHFHCILHVIWGRPISAPPCCFLPVFWSQAAMKKHSHTGLEDIDLCDAYQRHFQPTSTIKPEQESRDKHWLIRPLPWVPSGFHLQTDRGFRSSVPTTKHSPSPLHVVHAHPHHAVYGQSLGSTRMEALCLGEAPIYRTRTPH